MAVKSFGVTTALLALAASSIAEWANLPLATVVADTDLAIVGTLSDVAEVPQGDLDVGRATLTVEKTIFGSEATRKLSLTWANERDVDCPRAEPWRHRGVRAIWLLRLKRDGTYDASY